MFWPRLSDFYLIVTNRPFYSNKINNFIPQNEHFASPRDTIEAKRQIIICVKIVTLLKKLASTAFFKEKKLDFLWEIPNFAIYLSRR